MNQQYFFSKQLAMWFFHVDWRYVTLLGITIDCVDELPDDCDSLINELLLRYPEKPSQVSLTAHLLSSDRLSGWFARGAALPKITRFNLESPVCEVPANSGNHDYPKIDTLRDLADWLILTDGELNWLAGLWRFDATEAHGLRHYRYQLMEKRDGRMRLIEKPQSNLKRVQRKINREILSKLETHPAAYGFCKGGSCLSHASVHIGKQYLLQFDIEECFQSIGWPMVKAVFRRLGYPQAVSNHLTALCTHSVRLNPRRLQPFSPAQRDRLKQRHLPQGAPTSPALANAALHSLDLRLTGLAERFGLDYSRYADDIAFSGNRHRDWRFLEPIVGGICRHEGVVLNHRKSRIKKPHQKQRMVGIVVNSKANVDRKYFDTLKAILTNCRKYGLDSQNRQGHADFRAHLLGRVQYVKSLNKQRGLKLEKIYLELT